MIAATKGHHRFSASFSRPTALAKKRWEEFLSSYNQESAMAEKRQRVTVSIAADTSELTECLDGIAEKLERLHLSTDDIPEFPRCPVITHSVQDHSGPGYSEIMVKVLPSEEIQQFVAAVIELDATAGSPVNIARFEELMKRNKVAIIEELRRANRIVPEVERQGIIDETIAKVFDVLARGQSDQRDLLAKIFEQNRVATIEDLRRAKWWPRRPTISARLGKKILRFPSQIAYLVCSLCAKHGPSCFRVSLQNSVDKQEHMRRGPE